MCVFFFWRMNMKYFWWRSFYFFCWNASHNKEFHVVFSRKTFSFFRTFNSFLIRIKKTRNFTIMNCVWNDKNKQNSQLSTATRKNEIVNGEKCEQWGSIFNNETSNDISCSLLDHSSAVEFLLFLNFWIWKWKKNKKSCA